MAEIKDVYSLEFNASQFQSEIDSAIARIEELNGAMSEGADVADELAVAQGSLVDILGTEAKGVEQLNQKRNVLVNTQKNLNKETKSGVVVNNELNKTNKQLAVTTGQAAEKQKSLGSQLLQGARNINGLRRAGMMLGNVFRMIGGINPFGLLLTAIPMLIEYMQGLTSAQKVFNEAAESAIETYAKEKVALDDLFVSLSDVSLKGQERSDLINQINEQYGEYLPNLLNEKSTNEEIAAAYDLVNEALIKKAVTQAKTKALEDATAKLLKDQVFSLQSIADSEQIIAEQRAAGYGKVSQGATDNIKRQKRNLKISEEIYKDSLKTIDQASKNLETVLLQNTLKSGQIQEKSTLKNYNNLRKNNKAAVKAEKEKNTEFIKSTKLASDLIEKYMKKTAKNTLDLYDKIKKAEEEYQQMLEDSINRRNDSIDELNLRLNTQADIEISNRERQLNNELILIEQQRNETLKSYENNAEEQEKINKIFDKRRLDLENQANKEIIKLRIDLLNKLRNVAVSTGDNALIADIDKQLSELELKFTELNKVTAETTDDTKNLNEEYKKLVDQTAQVLQLTSDTVFSVLNANVQAYIEGLDKAIDKSKSALDEIRANSENYNAQQLEIEKERLEKLESERAKAVEREKTLGQIQVAINAAIAISKAAAEGGGFASAFTIAATLASLIAGLAQARVAAGNAFYHGVEYLERGNNKPGRDTIPAMLNEGERVITTDTNSRYWDVLSAVHNNRIPADVLNSFANAYQSGGLKAALGAFGENVSLSSELGNKSIFVNVAQTYQGMENRLERIEAVLTDLPKYMPRTVVSANANGIFKIVEQRQRRKNFSSNWSK